MLGRPVAALLVLLLAACGGGGSGDSGGAESGTAPPPPPAVASAGATAPPSGTTAPPGATCALPDFVAQSLARVNEQRARGADCGSRGSFGPAPALAWNDALTVAATAHSNDMATRNYFAHDSPEGGTLADRVNAAGYRWRRLAENIAAGYGSIDSVMQGWADSDGHCANLMNPGLRDIGMACVRATGATYSTYWTMDLGAQP